MFVPGKPFQPSLVFEGKARAYPSEVPFLALPTNTRLGWKGLPGTHILAYCGNPEIMAVTSFMIQAHRALVNGGTN